MITLAPAQEHPSHGRCTHLGQIPGLDADFCSVCRVWWVDDVMRQTMLDRRK